MMSGAVYALRGDEPRRSSQSESVKVGFLFLIADCGFDTLAVCATSAKTKRSVPSTVQGEVENIVGMGCVSHIDPHRADCVLPTLSIGIMVSSVAPTCDCRTRSPINSYNGVSRPPTLPHQRDCVAREISNPCRSKMSSSRYSGGWHARGGLGQSTGTVHSMTEVSRGK